MLSHHGLDGHHVRLDRHRRWERTYGHLRCGVCDRVLTGSRRKVAHERPNAHQDLDDIRWRHLGQQLVAAVERVWHPVRLCQHAHQLPREAKVRRPGAREALVELPVADRIGQQALGDLEVAAERDRLLGYDGQQRE